jgi:opacity protein-like surface antigen
MRTKLQSLLLIFAASLSSSVFADNYLGLSYVQLIETSQWPTRSEPTAIQIASGAKVHDYIGVEGRFGFGLSKDEGIKLDNYFGAYAKFHITPKSVFDPYILLGYTIAELSGDNGFPRNGDKKNNDFSNGFGINFNLSEKAVLNIEWVRYIDGQAITLDRDIKAISLGGAWNF